MWGKLGVLLLLSPSTAWQPQSLRDIYQTYDEGPVFDHWLEYADLYEKHLPKPDGKTPLRLLEIGVQSGGSARVWRKWYGSPLTYVGIDVNDLSKQVESPSENIFVEIGSQLDDHFLLSTCAKHGPFDVIVDDGGHTTEMIHNTLNTLWTHRAACMTPDAIYVIEDLHAMAACELDYCENPMDVPGVITKAFYGMHAHWRSDGALPLPVGVGPLQPAPQAWASELRSIQLYDSMAFLQRGAPIKKMTRVTRGSILLPYHNPSNANEALAPVGEPIDVSARKPSLAIIRARNALEGGTWTDENLEQSFIQQAVRPGDTVLEIGANIGRSTIVAAEVAGPKGRVVSSEADPGRLAMAKRNTQRHAAHRL